MGFQEVEQLEHSSMETMSSSSSSVPQEASTYDEISMQQSLLFSDSLKDLKNLRAQLYSAAEYFEVSYNKDDRKQIVVDTLKDYAVRAIVNTVDHLGSATYKVNGFLDEKVDEVTGTELRVSCIEQRLRTCQEYVDHGGLSEQSLVITTPKYHKRYILPVEETMNGSARTGAKYQSFIINNADNELRKLRTATRMVTRDTPPPIRKARSPSPSPRSRALFFTDKRASSPSPASRLLRSGSLSSRPTTPNAKRSTTPTSSQTHSTTMNSSKTHRRYPSEPRRAASMPTERDGRKETDQHPSKSKSILKALLSRRKSKNDPSLYSYLDEY